MDTARSQVHPIMADKLCRRPLASAIFRARSFPMAASLMPPRFAVRFIEWFILALGSKIRSEVLSLIDSASLPISWHPHLRELVILQLLPR